jgi:hypothetical protein
MVVAHRNEGIAPLDTQLKHEYPGIVIGWIGDPAHQSRNSAHNPNKYGRVNAIDPMISPHFTWNDAVQLTSTLAFHADKRINNIIFNKHIWDDANGYWTQYNGDDPHTNHIHIEVHDIAYLNTNQWNLNPEGDYMPTAKEIVDELLNRKIDINVSGKGEPNMQPIGGILRWTSQEHNQAIDLGKEANDKLTEVLTRLPK